MTRYTMALVIGGKELSIPVLPDKLAISSPGRGDKATVIELGEILLLRDKGLRSISWSSLFPACSAPFVTGDMVAPIEAIGTIQKARDAKKEIQFLLVGTDLDVNMPVGVDNLSYEERAGEPGDIYYDITLTEWKNYSPRRAILPSKPEDPGETLDPDRPADPPVSKTYTVAPGDSLWAIAKKHYGDGARWKEIYEANKGVVGNNPNRIYPGQVFVIP